MASRYETNFYCLVAGKINLHQQHPTWSWPKLIQETWHNFGCWYCCCPNKVDVKVIIGRKRNQLLINSNILCHTCMWNLVWVELKKNNFLKYYLIIQHKLVEIKKKLISFVDTVLNLRKHRLMQTGSEEKSSLPKRFNSLEMSNY